MPSIDADVKDALEQLQIVLDPVAKADSLEHAQKVCNGIRTAANGFLSRVLSLSFGADLLARTQEKFILMQNDLRNSQMLGQIQAGMSSKPNLNDPSSFEMKAPSKYSVAVKQWAEVSTTGKSIEKSSSERFLKDNRCHFDAIWSSVKKQREHLRMSAAAFFDQAFLKSCEEIMAYLKKQRDDKAQELANIEQLNLAHRQKCVVDHVSRADCKLLDASKQHLPDATECGYTLLLDPNENADELAEQFKDTTFEPREKTFNALREALREFSRVVVCHQQTFINMGSQKMHVFTGAVEDKDVMRVLTSDGTKPEFVSWLLEVLHARSVQVWNEYFGTSLNQITHTNFLWTIMGDLMRCLEPHAQVECNELSSPQSPPAKKQKPGEEAEMTVEAAGKKQHQEGAESDVTIEADEVAQAADKKQEVAEADEADEVWSNELEEGAEADEADEEPGGSDEADEAGEADEPLAKKQKTGEELDADAVEGETGDKKQEQEQGADSGGIVQQAVASMFATGEHFDAWSKIKTSSDWDNIKILCEAIANHFMIVFKEQSNSKLPLYNAMDENVPFPHQMVVWLMMPFAEVAVRLGQLWKNCLVISSTGHLHKALVTTVVVCKALITWGRNQEPFG